MDVLQGTEPDDSAVVSVRGLSKSYGGTLVVDALDLDVFPGEIVGIIGANGAGKTTAVECLQGLRRPDAGRLRVLGLDPSRDGQRLRTRIGSQLQDSGLPDRMRVREAVDLFAGPGAADPDALMEKFGIAHRARTAFAGLSGGERQRLFLVLALLNRPRLVILDELTQGLDPAARRGVWAAVDQLRAAGVTVLLVTHELSEAEVLCDRVIAMRAGRVLDRGTPAELIGRHAGQAVIRFSLPETDDASLALAVRELAALLDVQSVDQHGNTITVRGTRSSIAHVGAWLTSRSRPIPSDLDVDLPDLEEALLTLLERDEDEVVS
ncbi:ABC transporter ATP-binding protein [Aeromicrobium sp. YIM 150415]|uniref:ABC transporter ATP-binding protein n=1 Tax=Aeromicrobium sp. YIM 150415 TaxID=2803912 RepID=UPI0019646766|nr:ABC transporter ATP-binding protein [Aeromicrobium sp. YIM 150415]MBM9465374.1 ABC transporter ATP-binding protein [Aeromicrobium sp. YIM 150415]